jgi:WD40 repeat protein
VSDGALVRTLLHPEGVTSIDFSHDGEWLASGSYDGAVRVWRVRDGALVRTLAGRGATVWSVAFSPDGRQIASGGEDRTVKLWRTADGVLLHTLTGHTLNVWHVAFSPDGQLVGSSSFDHSIRLWRADTGAPIRTLSGHSEAVVGFAFSADGKLLASGSDDSSIKLWRVSDGRLLRTIPVGNHIYSVAFSPDGQWLAGSGRERGTLGTLWKQIVGHTWLRGSNRPTVRVWRVSDGSLQQALASHSDEVMSVAFSPNGKWLASSSDDKTVKLWQLEIGAGKRY